MNFHISLGHEVRKPIQVPQIKPVEIKIEPQSEDEVQVEKEVKEIQEIESEESTVSKNAGMYYYCKLLSKLQNRKAKWIEKQKFLESGSSPDTSMDSSASESYCPETSLFGWGGWTNTCGGVRILN